MTRTNAEFDILANRLKTDAHASRATSEATIRAQDSRLSGTPWTVTIRYADGRVAEASGASVEHAIMGATGASPKLDDTRR